MSWVAWRDEGNNPASSRRLWRTLYQGEAIRDKSVADRWLALSMLVTRGRQHRLSFVRVLERVRHDWHAGIRIDQHTEYVGGSDGQPALQL